jgi:DNA replication protein DnaC
MTDTPQLLLAHHLKALKLPTFLREYDKLARQCAAEGLDHIRFLLRLAELELIDRERRMVERRIKEARFGREEPGLLRLRRHSVAQQATRSRTRPLRIYRCPQNIIALGNSGTGKTHAIPPSI